MLNTKIIGIGCMSFNDTNTIIETIKYILGHVSQDTMILLDTAQFYGNNRGDNEKLIGSALGKLSDDEHKRLIVITKGGCACFFLETEYPDHSLLVDAKYRDVMYESADTFIQSWETSKANLGVRKYPHVRYGYFLHRRHHIDAEFIKQLEVLRDLYNNNEISYTGLSEVSLKDLEFANSIVPIHFLESEFSMNIQFLLQDGYISYCQCNNIKVLAYSPFSRGFWSELTFNDNSGVKQYFNMWKDENFNNLFPMLQEVQLFAKNKKCLTSQIAIAWIIAKGCIPIAGSSSSENNKTNINAHLIHLTPDELYQLDNIVYDMTKKWNIKRYL